MSETPKIIETNYGKEPISTEGDKISQTIEGQKITKNTKKETEKIQNGLPTQFDIIENNEKYSDSFKKTFILVGNYIEKKLPDTFNKVEKDNVKLVLLNDLAKQINSTKELSIKEKITKVLELSKSLNSNTINYSDTLKKLGIPLLEEGLNKKIYEIVEEKKENNYKTLKSTFQNIKGSEQPKGDILKSIKTNLSETSNKFEEYAKVGDTVKETIGEDNLSDLLEYLQKEFPLLGKIFAFIFGIFENNSNNGEKTKKSISNLQTFLEKKKKKSPLDKIEENKNFKNKEKLNPKKLETFYKYLDSKSIDYTKENFWEEFLNGTSKNAKIKELYNLLNSTQDKKLKGSQLKYISLEKFIETLNSLGKTEEKRKNKEITEHNLKIEEQIQEAKKSGDNKKVIELEKEIKYSFEDLLKQNKIEVNGKVKEFSIINGGKNIKIGENTYDISIEYWGERFISISGINGNYSITAKGPNGNITKKLNSQQIKNILQDLVIDDIVNNPSFNVGKYNVALKIIKKA